MIALLAAAAFTAALDVTPVRSAYARVRIPLAVDPGPARNYPDLRVRDDRGAEVPYVVQIEPEAEPPRVAAAVTTAMTRPDDAPTSQRATMELRAPNLEVTALRFDATTPTFARDVAIDVSDDGVSWSPVARERIARFRNVSAQLEVAAQHERARWWRATIENRDDAPLAGLRVALLVQPRDVVFPVVRTRRYRLTFGDPLAGAPSYDLRERLGHERWRAERGSTGPVVALAGSERAAADALAGRTVPPASPAALPGWLTPLAFTGAIVVLAAFALRLARAPDAPGPESD